MKFSQEENEVEPTGTENVASELRFIDNQSLTVKSGMILVLTAGNAVRS